MTSDEVRAQFEVVWTGGELLPDYPTRSSLLNAPEAETTSGTYRHRVRSDNPKGQRQPSEPRERPANVPVSEGQITIMRELRQRGWYLRDIASKVGLGFSTVHRFTRGIRKPSRRNETTGWRRYYRTGEVRDGAQPPRCVGETTDTRRALPRHGQRGSEPATPRVSAPSDSVGGGTW